MFSLEASEITSSGRRLNYIPADKHTFGQPERSNRQTYKPTDSLTGQSRGVSSAQMPSYLFITGVMFAIEYAVFRLFSEFPIVYFKSFSRSRTCAVECAPPTGDGTKKQNCSIPKKSFDSPFGGESESYPNRKIGLKSNRREIAYMHQIFTTRPRSQKLST